MTIYGRSEELVSRCVECDLAEPESLTSLGGSAPRLVEGILSSPMQRLLLYMYLSQLMSTLTNYLKVHHSLGGNFFQ